MHLVCHKISQVSIGTSFLDPTSLDQLRGTTGYCRQKVLLPDYLYKLTIFAVAICCQRIILRLSNTSDYPPHTSETFNKNILTGISWTKSSSCQTEGHQYAENDRWNPGTHKSNEGRPIREMCEVNRLTAAHVVWAITLRLRSALTTLFNLRRLHSKGSIKSCFLLKWELGDCGSRSWIPAVSFGITNFLLIACQT